MAGRLLGSAGGVMGAMALIKIFSATSKTGSTLAKVADTLLNSGGGGSGRGSGQGKRSGKGSSGEGSIAESMLAALKELKTNRAEGGNRRKPAGNARGQSGASAPAPASDTVVDTTALGQESRESGLDADRQALATLAGNIASFVDGRVRCRHSLRQTALPPPSVQEAPRYSSPTTRRLWTGRVSCCAPCPLAATCATATRPSHAGKMTLCRKILVFVDFSL